MEAIVINSINNKNTVVQCLNCDFIDSVLGVRRDYARKRGSGYGHGRCNECGSEAFSLVKESENDCDD